MSDRLPARLEVSALVRMVQSRGGSAAVLARGQDDAGAILLCLAQKGVFHGLYERRLGPDGAYGWAPSGPINIQSSHDLNSYLSNRRRIDPDLWVVELDVAEVERFAAELAAAG